MIATANIDNTDHSQTVRFPAGFELAGNEVWVRKDEVTGEVILSPKSPASNRHGLQALLPVEAVRRSALIDAVLAEMPVPEWGRRAADRYGTLAADLRRKVLPIGRMDTKISAHALGEGLILVTNNTDDFGRVQGLGIENWVEQPAGP